MTANPHRVLALLAALVLFVLVAFVYSTRASASVVWITQSGAGAATGVDLADAAPVSFVANSGNCGSGSTQIGAGTIVRFSGTFTYAQGTSGAINPKCSGTGTGASRVFYMSDPVNFTNVTSPQFGTGGGSPPAGGFSLHGLSHVFLGGNVPCGTTQGGVDQTVACDFIIQDTANGTAYDVSSHNSGQSFLIDAGCTADCEIANIEGANSYVRLPNWAISSVSFSGSTGTVTCAAPCPVGNGLNLYIVGNSLLANNTLLVVTANNSGGSTFTVSGGPTSGTGSGGTAVDENADTGGRANFNYTCIIGSASGILFHDSICHDGGWLVTLQETAGGVAPQIYNNQLYNMDHGIAMTPQAAGDTGPIIHDNHLHDMANWNDQISVGNNHHDGIHLEQDLTHNPQYSYTGYAEYNNQFDGNPGGNNWIFNRASSLNSAIFNNVFGCSPATTINIMENGDYNSGAGPSFTTNLHIYNNTVTCSGAYSGGGAAVGVANSNGNADETGLDWRNNVWQGQQFVAALGIENSSVFIAASPDYNLYGYNYADSGNTSGVWVFSTVGTGAIQTNCLRTNYPVGCLGSTTFASYLATTGSTAVDSHSVVVTAAALNLGSDGTPGLGSPEVGAGTNLTSLCTGIMTALCSDKKGRPRPATGPWDAGAVNFAASAVLPPVLSRTLQ